VIGSAEGDAKRRLTLGFASNLLTKLSGVLIQLVQVPLFLHFWSVPLFGEWMIVSSIPTYLSFSNIGFGSVAYNEMTISMAAGDQTQALRVFQSCWWLLIGLCAAIGCALGLALYFLPVGPLLGLHEIGSLDAKFVLLYLGLSVLLGQFEQLLGSAYTCVGRYPYGSFLKNCLTVGAFAATMIAVSLHHGVRDTAFVAAAANLLGTLYLCIAVRRDIPWISYGRGFARLDEIIRLTPGAIAFMGFPLGNAFNLQGTVLAVGYALGPQSVVIFGTARTVSRVALQLIQMVGMTIWPELSSAYGARNWALVRSLHRSACQIALLVAIAVVAGMATLGPWFLNHWTGGHVAPNRSLLMLLLLVVVLNALWSTSATLAIAINRHQRVALYYVLATGLTLACTYVAAKYLGLLGAAASLLIAEVIMNSYVLPNSLRISHDTYGEFFASFLRVPAFLGFAGLKDRLAALRPLRRR